MSNLHRAEQAAEIESTAGREATHHDLERLFGERRKELAEDDPLSQALSWDQWAFGLMLTEPGDYRDQWGPLAPKAVFPPNAYPPPVDAFPTEAIDYFRLRIDVAGTAVARARLADVMWIRTKEIGFGDLAISSYVEASLEVDGELGDMVRTEYIRRALDLARSLGRDMRPVREALFDLIERFVLKDSMGYAAMLVRASSKELAGDQSRAMTAVKSLEAGADRASAAGGQERHAERSLGGTAADLLDALGQTDAARVHREAIPRSFEAEATERSREGALIKSFLLKDALQLYANVGMSADAARLKSMVAEASQQATGEMTEISTTVKLPTEKLLKVVEELLEKGRQHAPWAHLVSLGCRSGLWPTWEDVSRRTQALQREHPLLSLVRQERVAPDGRSLPRPEGPEARRAYDEIVQFSFEVTSALAVSTTIVDLLRERDGWSVTLIMEALEMGAFFRPETIEAIRPGVEAFEAERHWEALHVLAVQIERVIRQLALAVGAQVYRYNPGKGEIRWASLEQMLDDPKVRAALQVIGKDWPDELKYLLVDSRGLNVRNEVGHGIIEVGGDASQHALLMILILLCFAALVRKGDEAVEPSPRGQTEAPSNP